MRTHGSSTTSRLWLAVCVEAHLPDAEAPTVNRILNRSRTCALIAAALLAGSFLAGCCAGPTPPGPTPSSPATTTSPPTSAINPTATTTSPLATPQPVGLAAVHMLTQEDGWGLAADTGYVLRTADGGTQWQDVSVPGVPPAANDVAYFLDTAHAWVAVTAPISASGPNTTTVTIYRTADGGQTWDSGAPVTISGGGPGSFDFIDSQHGWLLLALGAGAGSEAVEILRTVDGGTSWEVVSLTAGLPDQSTPGSLPLGCDKSGIGFADPATGWATGFCPGGKVFFYATRDGGLTWEWQTLPPPAGYPADLFSGCQCALNPPIFTSAQDGFMPVGVFETTDAWFLYITHDGGATWNPSPLPTTGLVDSVDFIDAGNGWFTDRELLYATHDGGQTWIPVGQFPTEDLSGKLNFVNTSDGWFTDGRQLYATHDGGVTWSAVATTLSASSGAPTTPDVTLADDGQTITLRVGQRFLLDLGAEYDWTVTVEDQAVVSRVVNVLTIRGSQGLYEAHEAGNTTLTATGDPVCRQAQPPCAAPSRAFQIEIVVE
jgi:photosystem II stability/assembly factor-like uncharacterized protein